MSCPKPQLENRRDGNPVRDAPAAVGRSGSPATAMRSISTAAYSAKTIQSASPSRSSARPSAADGGNPAHTAQRCRCWCFTSTAPEKIFLPGGAKYCSAPRRSYAYNSGVSERAGRSAHLRDAPEACRVEDRQGSIADPDQAAAAKFRQHFADISRPTDTRRCIDASFDHRRSCGRQQRRGGRS